MDVNFAIQYLWNNVGRDHVINEETYSSYMDIIHSFHDDRQGLNTFFDLDQPKIKIGFFSFFSWNINTHSFELDKTEQDPFQLALCVHELLEFIYKNTSSLITISILDFFGTNFVVNHYLGKKKVIDQFWRQKLDMKFYIEVPFTYKGQDLAIRSAYPDDRWNFHTEQSQNGIDCKTYTDTGDLAIFHRSANYMGPKVIIENKWGLTKQVMRSKYRVSGREVKLNMLTFERNGDVFNLHDILTSDRFWQFLQTLFLIEGKLPETLPSIEEINEYEPKAVLGTNSSDILNYNSDMIWHWESAMNSRGPIRDALGRHSKPRNEAFIKRAYESIRLNTVADIIKAVARPIDSAYDK